MNAYPKQTAEAARWIFARKDRSIDWNWPVLTKRNPDSETLGYSDVVSYQIFTILEKEGLIEPFAFQIGDRDIGSFKLCLHDSDTWSRVGTTPNWFRRFILWPAKETFSTVYRVFFWLISSSIVALLGALARHLVGQPQ